MMWILVTVGIVILAVALYSLTYLRGYGKIFAPDHYLEVARGVAKMKAGALADIIQGDDQPFLTPSDPRVLLTSKGVAFAYTIRNEAEGFVHHYSVSMPGGQTTAAVGQTFTLYVARLLAVPLDQLNIQVSPAGVHHAEFVLTPAGQAEFTPWKVTIPTAEEAREVHSQCQQVRAAAGRGA